ncbi:hypothetical protein HU200_044371 [Digitaria exilis]|uniref:Uncharacterized protein n=1 Tax=Digitaria exilis TaxID=1010633 RepID=A0A835B7L2_9POAL|nr:hypothetical protein HU200_044371 [Digitaria exilis]
MAFLALQIAKIYTNACSALYWVLTSVQIPVSVGVSIYEAHGLMSGKRVLSSTGNEQSSLKPGRLLMYCLFGIIGVGGGFILGPLLLELGILPQVSSATATFVMMFSSSMSVVQYYLLHRFPVPYGGVGIADIVHRMERHQYMGFENLCKLEKAAALPRMASG